MNKNTKIIISIVLVVIVLVSVFLIIYLNRQNKLSICMEKCSYISPKNPTGVPTGRSASSIMRSLDKGDYWQYIDTIKIFETQNQCLDYCLTK